MSKIKTLEIETEKGNLSLTVSTENREDDVLVCETRCPYGPCKGNKGKPVCECIPNPLNLSDSTTSFKDFCGELGEHVANKSDDDVDILENSVPVEGSVEKLMLQLGQDDVYQQLLEKKHLISLDKVIDCVCADGFCGSYEEDHCNCHSGNEFCLLKSILYKKIEDTKEEEKENESEEENNE